MNTIITTSIHTCFDSHEHRAFKQSIASVKELYNKLSVFSDDADFVSPLTGEVMRKNDLLRCCGILDGLLMQPVWEVESQNEF